MVRSPCTIAGVALDPVKFLHRPIAWILQQFDIAVRIHIIKRSDAGRDLHDHPWSFVTVLLHSGYIEHTPNGHFKRKQGDVIYHHYSDWHRLEIVPDHDPVVTLFITGPWKQKWGFLVDGKKMLAPEYHRRQS